jgi:hypothetical protein
MTQSSLTGGRLGARVPHLINRSETRKFILDTVQRTRPHLQLTRVSRETLDKLDHWLGEKIRNEVHSHPSVGKTFQL